MGYGDVLMSMGEARKLHKSTGGQKVMICGRDGRPIKSELFDRVPYLIHRPSNADGPYQRLINGPGHRPYIAGKTDERWIWRKYTPTPAEIFFSVSELEFAERYRGRVMIEPNVKAIGHDNKAWVGPRWRELAKRLADEGILTVQCVQGGVTAITEWSALTPTFRYACAVLSVCKAFIGTEGGLMHAAAAVGTPGVILWSEFISPDITGYTMHRNLRHAGKACGMRRNCLSCQQSMAAITVDEVMTNLKEILR